MNNLGIILVVFASFIIGLIAYPFLPNQVAIHWTFGEADQYINKIWVVALIPFIMIISHLISKMFTRKDFSFENKNNKKIVNIVNYSMISVLFLVHLIIILIGLDYQISFGFVMGLIIGIFIIILAYYSQHTKPNYIFGLRTIWTLRDERVWEISNKFASKVMMIIGLLIIFFAFIIPKFIILIMIILSLIGAAVSVYASYVFYKKINKK